MICPLCRGAQNLAAFGDGKPEWIDCPMCLHWGTREKKFENRKTPDLERLTHAR